MPELSSVFLVDDHPLVREWLANLISQQADMRICGEADNTSKALEGIAASNPNVAVIDISLGDSSGMELIKTIKLRHPQTAILVLSMHDEGLYAERAIRAGARGYIMKRETSKNVAAGIRAVLKGELYVSEGMARKFAEKFVDRKPPEGGSPVDQLSDRELEVFSLLGQGLETRQVAEKMRISIKTVQAYCARIKEKLKLTNASELVREAIRWAESDQPS